MTKTQMKVKVDRCHDCPFLEKKIDPIFIYYNCSIKKVHITGRHLSGIPSDCPLREKDIIVWMEEGRTWGEKIQSSFQSDKE